MINNLSEFFKAIGDPTRLRIVNLLLHYPACHVNEISQILEVPQSKISRNLSTLRHAGWLVHYRRDKWVYYKMDPNLDEQMLQVFKEFFKSYIQFDSDLKSAKNRG
jgi:DNA-binding transcriptional ArsR family regulator